MANTNAKVDNKPVTRNDAYTGLLAISFLAMVGATVLLYLELENYAGKPIPKTPTIEVPGVQLKSVPNSGGAPKIVEPKPAPPEEMPKEKEKEKDATMRLPLEAPPLLPPIPTAETAQALPAIPAPPPESAAIQPGLPAVEPGLPAPPSGIIQATAIEPVRNPQPQPIIPTVEPSLTDAPPIPASRFEPPK